MGKRQMHAFVRNAGPGVIACAGIRTITVTQKNQLGFCSILTYQIQHFVQYSAKSRVLLTPNGKPLLVLCTLCRRFPNGLEVLIRRYSGHAQPPGTEFL